MLDDVSGERRHSWLVFLFSSTRILINPGVCVTFIIDPAAMATEVVLEVC